MPLPSRLSKIGPGLVLTRFASTATPRASTANPDIVSSSSYRSLVESFGRKVEHGIKPVVWRRAEFPGKGYELCMFFGVLAVDAQARGISGTPRQSLRRMPGTNAS